MTQFQLTHAIAVAETKRRQEPRATRTRCSAMLATKALKVPVAQRKAAESVLMSMGTADLADAVELLAPKGRPAKAKAPAKPAKLTAEQNRARFAEQAKARKGTGVGGSTHTERRDAAWAHRAKVRAEGGKISVDEACALFGTAPAKVMVTMSAAEIAALEAGATLTV